MRLELSFSANYPIVMNNLSIITSHNKVGNGIPTLTIQPHHVQNYNHRAQMILQERELAK